MGEEEEGTDRSALLSSNREREGEMTFLHPRLNIIVIHFIGRSGGSIGPNVCSLCYSICAPLLIGQLAKFLHSDWQG